MIEAVTERLEGAPRQFRRRWSDEFKERAVAEAIEPGASVSVIAHRIGIHPSPITGDEGHPAEIRQSGFDRLTDVLLSRSDCATLKSIKKGLINFAYADLNQGCEASNKTESAISHFLSHYSLVASDLAAVEQKLKDIGAL